MPATVGDIMTRQVVTVSMDDSLETIRNVLERRGFHHLIVVEEGAAVGVISDRDLLRHLSPYAGTLGERPIDAATLSKRAHQIMSRRMVTADPDEPIGEAVRRMLDRRISCLPVLSPERRCLGLLTWRDVLRWTLETGALTKPAPERDAA